MGLIGDDRKEQNVTNSPSPFYFAIPRSPTQSLPSFETMENTLSSRQNDSTIPDNGPINLLALNGFLISSQNVSIHYQIKPNVKSENASFPAYFAALKFGGNPYLNSTFQRYDMWKIFCPQGNANTFFLSFSFNHLI